MIGIICTIILDSLLLFFLVKRNKDYPFGKFDYVIMAVTALVALYFSRILNGFFEDVLLQIFKDRYYIIGKIFYWKNGNDLICFNFFYYFLVALVEETLKHIVLFVQFRKKEIRSYLDCIISFLFVSVIFSVVEDIFYFKEYGSTTAQLRFIVEISGHLMFSMFVGESYYKYQVNKKMVVLDAYLKDIGAVDRSVVVKPRFISIFLLGFSIAVVLHWLYNFLINFSPILGWMCIIIYGIVFIFRYKNALKNKFISTKAVEKYAGMQFQVSKKEIYDLVLNKTRD